MMHPEIGIIIGLIGICGSLYIWGRLYKKDRDRLSDWLAADRIYVKELEDRLTHVATKRHPGVDDVERVNAYHRDKYGCMRDYNMSVEDWIVREVAIYFHFRDDWYCWNDGAKRDTATNWERRYSDFLRTLEVHGAEG